MHQQSEPADFIFFYVYKKLMFIRSSLQGLIP